MIHFVPDLPGQGPGLPFAQGTRRLAALRHALGLVEELAGRAGDDRAPPPAAVRIAGPARRDWFDSCSLEAVTGCAAGVEAMAVLGSAGGRANPLAADHLADHIRGRLEALGAILSL